MSDTIYVITTLERIEKGKNGTINTGIARTVGWYPDLSDAQDAVMANYCDIYEGIYEYAIIEESRSGLYQAGHKRWLYKFDKAENEYKKINEPGILKSWIGFSIG